MRGRKLSPPTFFERGLELLNGEASMAHRFIRFPQFNPVLEPAYQLKLAGLSAPRKNAISTHRLTIKLSICGAPEQKYRPDQPRIPAGNPFGGRWTDGSLSADPFNIGSLLDQYGWISSGEGLLFDVAEADIPALAGAVMGWLGPDAYQRNSPIGAIQFFSADGTRIIRFDITPGTSHGLRPHINIEPGRLHIFPR